LQKNPNEIANLIKEKIANLKEVEKIEVVGGFINFYLS
jgi:arginyl-tRNA synthetase